MAFTATELQLISDGTASDPSLHFRSSRTTGVYTPTIGELCLTASGVGTFTVKTGSAGAILEVGVLQVPDGTAALPSYTFTSDSDSGVYKSGTDQIGITAGGVQVMHFDSIGVSLASGYIDAPAGSEGAPTYTFTGDVDTGIYAPTGDDLSFSTGGTRRLLLDNLGMTLASGAIIDTDGGALTLQTAGGVGVLVTDDPVIALGIATKQYVDAIASGLNLKASCRLATTTILAAVGSGNIITATALGALFVDSVPTVIGDRILVKDDITGPNKAYNGIFTVTAVGDGSNEFVLTRATDADSDAELTAGTFTFIAEGTDNADIGYVLTTNDPITVNTTLLTFSQFTTQGGDIVGPGTSTQDAFMRWDNATGTLAQDSANVTMDDAGELTFTEGTTALRGIVYPDSLADAFHFKDTSSTLMTFNSNTDQVLFPTGIISLSNASTAVNSIRLVDNLSDSLSIEIESGTKFLKFDTTNTVEVLAVGTATTFAGGITYASSTIATNTALDSTHYLVRADTSGGNIALTLPAIASHNGRQYKIYKSAAANTLSIDPNASENIDGVSTTLLLTAQYDHITLICNSTDGWFTM